MLVTRDGTLKLADFGLSRFVQEKGEYTNRVITRWYRPPELLLGETRYTSAIDMWSVGCILGELLLQKPILQGKNELDQLAVTFELCGTPTKETWPDAFKLPLWQKMSPNTFNKRRLKEVFAKYVVI